MSALVLDNCEMGLLGAIVDIFKIVEIMKKLNLI